MAVYSYDDLPPIDLGDNPSEEQFQEVVAGRLKYLSYAMEFYWSVSLLLVMIKS